MRRSSLFALALVMLLPAAAEASNERTLYFFQGGADGANPTGRLKFGPHTNSLFGTTQYGGEDGSGNLIDNGVVFELDRVVGQRLWTSGFKTLHTFSALDVNGDNSDGANPVGGVIRDLSGNLYVATSDGGNGPAPSAGCGTVIKLTPSGNSYTTTPIYEFSGGSDANCAPFDTPTEDAGTIYLSTSSGSINQSTGSSAGTIVKLTPPTNGTLWTGTTIYAFNDTNTSSDYPTSHVIVAPGPVIYGTAQGDGNQATAPYGSVFKLTPPANGTTWTATTLYEFTDGNADSFDGNVPDGGNPNGGVIEDSNGVLYGTTTDDANGSGTIYKVISRNNMRTLYTFGSYTTAAGLTDGATPNDSLVADSHGNLYGTTQNGGDFTNCGQGCGTVFELSPPTGSNTSWTLTTLHYFHGGFGDGANPVAGLIMDGNGWLYGVAENGGSANCTDGCGTVFMVKP